MQVPKPVRNTVLTIFIVVMLTVLALMLLGRNHDAFAQCLTSKGVVMYGLKTCPACAEQKERFGSSFSYITYVECSQQDDVCEGLQYFPTWEFPDGGQIVGVQELKQLARLSGCKI